MALIIIIIINDRDEMRVLRGVVYIMKCKGLKTEP